MAPSKMDLTATTQFTSTVKVPKKPLSFDGSVPVRNPDEFFTSDFILDLRKLLVEREGCEITSRVQSSGFSETLNMSALEGDTTVMVRVFNHTQLIVKYVILTNQRVGTLTEFVRRLCQNAVTSGLQTLVVESVLTPEMRQWCLKYGLVVDPSSGESKDGLGLGYAIPISEFLSKVN